MHQVISYDTFPFLIEPDERRKAMSHGMKKYLVLFALMLGSVPVARAEPMQVDSCYVNFNTGPVVFELHPGDIVNTGLALPMPRSCSPGQCSSAPADGTIYWPLKLRCSSTQQTQYGAHDLALGEQVSLRDGQVVASCTPLKLLTSDCAYNDGNYTETSYGPGSLVRFGTDIVAGYSERNGKLCLSEVRKSASEHLIRCGDHQCQQSGFQSSPKVLKELSCFNGLEESASYIAKRYCETGMRISLTGLQPLPPATGGRARDSAQQVQQQGSVRHIELPDWPDTVRGSNCVVADVGVFLDSNSAEAHNIIKSLKAKGYSYNSNATNALALEAGCQTYSSGPNGPSYPDERNCMVRVLDLNRRSTYSVKSLGIYRAYNLSQTDILNKLLRILPDCVVE
jgi:hypothetical protein